MSNSELIKEKIGSLMRYVNEVVQFKDLKEQAEIMERLQEIYDTI